MTSSSDNYYRKYMKYKNKYLQIQLFGGNIADTLDDLLKDLDSWYNILVFKNDQVIYKKYQ